MCKVLSRVGDTPASGFWIELWRIQSPRQLELSSQGVGRVTLSRRSESSTLVHMLQLPTHSEIHSLNNPR